MLKTTLTIDCPILGRRIRIIPHGKPKPRDWKIADTYRERELWAIGGINPSKKGMQDMDFVRKTFKGCILPPKTTRETT